jgi:hypothetical protein
LPWNQSALSSRSALHTRRVGRTLYAKIAELVPRHPGRSAKARAAAAAGPSGGAALPPPPAAGGKKGGKKKK